MNEQEAQELLERELGRFRSESYAELARRVGEISGYPVTAPSGVRYQVEIQIFWDGKPQDNVRVMGAIDDGGFRALVPLTLAFIMDPAGGFVDED